MLKHNILFSKWKDSVTKVALYIRETLTNYKKRLKKKKKIKQLPLRCQSPRIDQKDKWIRRAEILERKEGRKE